MTELKRDFFTHLSFSISEPHISLALTPAHIFLYIGKDDPVSRGIFEKIKNVLVQRKRPPAWLLNSFLISGLVTGFSPILLFVGFSKSNLLLIVLGFLTLLVGALWSWYGFQNQFKRYSIIIPKYRIDSPSFLKRNGDRIVLATISAIIGGVITLLFAKGFGVCP